MRINKNEFWADSRSFFGSRNKSRAILTVKLLSGLDCKSVLDIGCGDQAVREYIDEEKCRYYPADYIKRSPDCIRVDLEKEYPEGEYDAVLSIGVVQYIENRDALYMNIARSCRYWISSTSAAASMLSRYRRGNFSYRGPGIILSEKELLDGALRYFNIRKRVTCLTGCQVIVWQPKSSGERDLVDKIKQIEHELEEWAYGSKSAWLRSHIRRRDEYMDKLRGVLKREIQNRVEQAGGCGEYIEGISLVIDQHADRELSDVKERIKNSQAEYIILSIGYPKSDQDAKGSLDYTPKRYTLEEYIDKIEEEATKRHAIVYTGLSPDYSAIFIFRQDSQLRVGED